jgi:hypothetical protein
MLEDTQRLKDPEVLRAYVEQALRSVMPTGWHATRSEWAGLAWRLEPVDSEGSIERSYSVHAFTAPPTLVITHGNSDGGGNRSMESLMLRRATLIHLEVVGFVPLVTLLHEVLRQEPDVSNLT